MKPKGFTLIEVLIVVAIIAILAAIALPQFHYFMLKSRRTDAILSLRNFHLSEMGYFSAYDTHPDDASIASALQKLGLTSFFKFRSGFYYTNNGFRIGAYLVDTQATSLKNTGYYLDLRQNLDLGDLFEDIWFIKNNKNGYNSCPSAVPFLYFNDLKNTGVICG